MDRMKDVVGGSLAAVLATVSTLFAANPTERRWMAAEGDVSAASSWNNGTLPAQGTATANGEMAYFAGAGDKTVKFPAGGWTDTGVYYFAKALDNGTTLTFDATGTSWLMDAGRYFSYWQIFTLCGGDYGGVSYPHLLQVSQKTSTAAVANPVFKLTDGVVKFVKDTTAGNVLSLERGEWNFRDSNGTVTDQNILTIFNSEGSSAEDQFVLRPGTTLKAPSVILAPGAGIPAARFRVEGGAHTIDTLTIGAAKGEAATPIVMEMTNGSLVAGTVIVGNRGTTEANTLQIAGMAQLTANQVSLANVNGSGASLTVSNNATLVLKTLRMCGNDSALCNDISANLEITDDADVTLSSWFQPNVGKGARNHSETTIGGNAKVHLTATLDSGSAAGGLYLGGATGGDATSLTHVKITDNALVETAARTTIGHNCAASNVVEICGNATFENSNDYGIILGRGAPGRGYLVVKGNATVRLTGAQSALALSGNLQYGDNLGSEERVDILGGDVWGKASLALGGTNAWVNLAGGETSFATWSIGGEPRYKITDENWILPTNTVRITGGMHTVRAYNSSGVAIMIAATNGNTRLLMEGGALNASGMIAVGSATNGKPMVGAPGVLTMKGGTLLLAQKDGSTAGDSKLMVGQPGGSKGRFELLGGEVVANSIRGGSGQSSFLADGGTFTVLNTVANDWALSRLQTAELGAKGLTVKVPAGIRAINQQTFTDGADAAGLFVKTGVGTLVTSNASAHAQTTVSEGLLVLGSGITQFGRKLVIEPGAFVVVDVPAAVGSYAVLTLGAELSAEELPRLHPETWADGFSYAFSQITADGVTTVTCTVTEGGPSARALDESTTYTEAQTLASRLTVGANAAVNFQAPVEIVGAELVIDVAAGATVTFEQSIASVYTAVRKIGAGRVVFRSANPSFFGTWSQEGGVFDVQNADFSAGANGVTLVKDTLAYSAAEPGTLASSVTVNGGSHQKRVVAQVDQDLTCEKGWNSLGGGLVKTGAGSLVISEPKGTFALGSSAVSAGDTAVDAVPTDGSSPADADATFYGGTAGAGLQILSGRVKVVGAGRDVTTVNNQQSIFVGTKYAAAAQPGLVISNCTYNADGSARSTTIGSATTTQAGNQPSLTIGAATYKSHRMLIGSGTPTVDVYPTVTIADSIVTFESGFNVGQNNDRIHPRLTLDNTMVTQKRDGYAMGHYFCRDFEATLTNSALLNATYTSGAGANWHGIRFESGAWGTLRVTTGSTLQTSRFEFLGTGTEKKHVELVFDGGTLDITSDASGNDLSAKTAVKSADDAFVSEGEGMAIHLGDGISHTFAAPIRGTGVVRKTGAGTLVLGAVADGKPVFRGTGDVVVQEGVLDLGGQMETNVCFVGAGGTLRNGTCAIKAVAGSDALLDLGGAVTVARVVVEAGETELARGQVIPVAELGEGATVNVNGCKVVTEDPSLRGTASVKNGRLVVTLDTRKRFMIIFR